MANMLGDIPAKSITLDNDLSFQKHEELSELIQATVFFCHSYCSHEKRTVENRNKAIRKYVPKKSDLSSYKLKYFKEVEDKLRSKYMKCLDYKTPQESWDIKMEKWKKKHAMIGALKTKGSVRLQG